VALLGEASEEDVVADGVSRDLRLGPRGGTEQAQRGAERGEAAVGEDDGVEGEGITWDGAEADGGGGEARGGEGGEPRMRRRRRRNRREARRKTKTKPVGPWWEKLLGFSCS